MIYLGLNIYYWGARPQNRLLVDFLEPTVRELRKDALVNWFWFSRFGARGPHVFALLRVPAVLRAEVTSRLSQALDSYLAVNPSDVVLESKEIAIRHAECRGKAQCEADRYPGFASNNSYCMFEHNSQGYPFNLSAGLPAGDTLWELIERLTLWAIQQLTAESESASPRTVIHFVAAVDRALRTVNACAEDYWRYHATTLLLVLKQRLATDEQELLDGLPHWIGDKNTALFSSFWDDSGSSVDRALVGQLAQAVLAAPHRSTKSRWAPLREIVHSTLKQLALPVSSHIPLVLFAWHRNAFAERVTADPI